MEENKMEKWVSLTLRWGIRSSAVFLIIGCLAFLSGPQQASMKSPTVFVVVSQIIHSDRSGLSSLAPYIFLYAGILLLMITPLARVIITLIGFATERDWNFVLVSFFILCVIIVSITYSIVTH